MSRIASSYLALIACSLLAATLFVACKGATSTAAPMPTATYTSTPSPSAKTPVTGEISLIEPDRLTGPIETDSDTNWTSHITADNALSLDIPSDWEILKDSPKSLRLFKGNYGFQLEWNTDSTVNTSELQHLEQMEAAYRDMAGSDLISLRSIGREMIGGQDAFYVEAIQTWDGEILLNHLTMLERDGYWIALTFTEFEDDYLDRKEWEMIDRIVGSIRHHSGAAAGNSCPTPSRSSNLRSGPGTNFAITGAVRPGECLDIVAKNEDGTWYQLADGKWIAAFLVDLVEDTSRSSDGPIPVLEKYTEAYVVRVIDGDTIEVELAGQEGVAYRVRYIGVNTPEADELFGSEATAQNRTLVESQMILLEKDVSETDRYGRLLRYVWLPGEEDRMVNYELVRMGYAQVATYPPDVKYQSLFVEAQQAAQAENLGLWDLR